MSILSEQRIMHFSSPDLYTHHIIYSAIYAGLQPFQVLIAIKLHVLYMLHFHLRCAHVTLRCSCGDRREAKRRYVSKKIASTKRDRVGLNVCLTSNRSAETHSDTRRDSFRFLLAAIDCCVML